MKSIIFLGSTLVVLLSGTYFLKEKLDFFSPAEKKEQVLVIDPKLGDLISFEIKDAKIIKKVNGEYVTSNNYPAELEKVNFFLNALSNLKIDRKLPLETINEKNQRMFFPSNLLHIEFKFQKGALKYQLGKKLRYSRSFYLKIHDGEEESFVIVSDTSPQKGVYDKNVFHRNAGQYRKVQSLMLLNDSFFQDTRVVKKPKIVEGLWNKIKVENYRNRPFSLNFNSFGTNPPSPLKNGHNKEKLQAYRSRLLNLRGESVIFPFEKDRLTGRVSVVKFESQDSKNNIIFSLYKNYGGQKGNFLATNLDQGLIELNKTSSQLFYFGHQDFWEKRPIQEDLLSPQNSVPFSIKFPGKKEIDLKIEKGKNFNVTRVNMKDRGPVNHSFKSLFRFLNQSPERLGKVYNLGNVLKKSKFRIKIKDRVYHAIFEDGEMMLLNEGQSLGHYYWVGRKPPIGLVEKDYFFN